MVTINQGQIKVETKQVFTAGNSLEGYPLFFKKIRKPKTARMANEVSSILQMFRIPKKMYMNAGGLKPPLIP